MIHALSAREALTTTLTLATTGAVLLTVLRNRRAIRDVGDQLATSDRRLLAEINAVRDVEQHILTAARDELADRRRASGHN